MMGAALPVWAGYRLVPMKEAFVRRARGEHVDDQLQPVERTLALGGEPCRDVLRGARAGEAILLASYCPFTLAGLYREYGPVFLLAEPSAEPLELARLPCAPQGDYFGATFVLRAYCAAERIVGAVLSTPLQAEADLQSLFARSDVAFVLARFAAYGCYGVRIERS